MPYRKKYTKKRSYGRKGTRKGAFKRRGASAFKRSPKKRSTFRARAQGKAPMFRAQPRDLASAAGVMRLHNKEVEAVLLENAASKAAMQAGKAITLRGLAPGWPLPQRVRTKFTWTAGLGRFLLDGSQTTQTLATFWLNTLNTANNFNTSATEGDIGYAEMSVWYENYMVYGTKLSMDIEITGVNAGGVLDSASLATSAAIGFHVYAGFTAPTSPTLFENWRTTPNLSYVQSKDSTTLRLHHTVFVKARDMLGPAFVAGGSSGVAMTLVGPFLSDGQYNASTNFRPQLSTFVQVLGCSPGGVSAPGAQFPVAVVLNIKMEHYVECFNPTGNQTNWEPAKGMFINNDRTYTVRVRPMSSHSRRSGQGRRRRARPRRASCCLQDRR